MKIMEFEGWQLGERKSIKLDEIVAVEDEPWYKGSIRICTRGPFSFKVRANYNDVVTKLKHLE